MKKSEFERMKRADTDTVNLYISELLDCPQLGPQIVCHRVFPEAPAAIGSNIRPWSRPIERMLKENGLKLYTHQALATDYVRSGRSIVVATPTASGKSLIYNLPVMDNLLRDPESRALYLFPLKALAQDQLGAFNELVSVWPKDARPVASLYDGDTGENERRKIRTNPPAVLLSNPEMLHLSLLPYHEKWATFLANLNYVVVDEAHTYRGIFGSHMAQVFRRLNRVCEHYGTNPSYVFCTATLGNPEVLAADLIGKDVALIDKSGAPRGKRHFLFVNPAASSATCAIDLLKRALELNLRTIVYCRTRKMTELISLWAGSESGEYRKRISAYRAGFLPEERREIEAKMANGELRAVVSTSALELGIDIGGLDVCILVGYPGTIMQTFQRGGRVGRQQRESAVLLVAGEDALDQYFMRNPEDFFSRKPEKAVINPDNEVILERHIECAAAELPLMSADPWLKNPGAVKALKKLHEKKLIVPSSDGSYWRSMRKYPQRNMDLRGSGETYHIENEEGQIIGSIDGFRAWRETHPGAIYIHRGRTYEIESVDDGRKKIRARPSNASWFTRVRSRKETEILEEYDRMALGRCAVFFGRLRITEIITGYEKRAVKGNKLISITPLEVAPQIFETEGLWFVIPDTIRQKIEAQFLHFMGSIHAMEHALIGMLPLEVIADRNDFGGISIPLHPQTGLPSVFIYDSLPGGAGLTRAAFPESLKMLETTYKNVADCDCEDGCPTCIQSPKCGAGNRPLSKQGVLELFSELLEAGNEGEAICKDIEPHHCIPPENIHTINLEKDERLPISGQASATPCRGDPIGPPARYVVLDVETRRSAADVGGWNMAEKMGVSIAVLYDSQDDCYHSYTQDKLELMFEKMLQADLVVGFNILKFDYKVLQPFAQKKIDFSKVPTLDLLQRISEKLNYRVSLENLGKSTLNTGKSADGLMALKWWKEGKIREIEQYCKKDVELTRDLYLRGLKERHLFYSNKLQARIKVNVDFAFPSSGRKQESPFVKNNKCGKDD